MGTFEYLSVLVSVVVGLGVVHILEGIGRLISETKSPRLYWVHTLWVVESLAYLIFFWWFQLGYRPIERWTSALFVFVLLYAVAIYLQCVVVLPKAPQGDYEEYFFTKRRWLYGIVMALLWIDLFDTYLKPRGVIPYALPAPGALAAQAVILSAVLGLGMYTRKKWYHALVVVVWTLNTLVSLLARPEPGG